MIGDGTINFEEFESLLGLDSSSAEKKKIERAFKAIDTDGNGVLSPLELKDALALLGENLTLEEVYQLIKMFDYDSDCQIDIDGKASPLTYFIQLPWRGGVLTYIYDANARPRPKFPCPKNGIQTTRK